MFWETASEYTVTDQILFILEGSDKDTFLKKALI